jgi:choline dehydrogenase-like flavoprotein
MITMHGRPWETKGGVGKVFCECIHLLSRIPCLHWSLTKIELSRPFFKKSETFHPPSAHVQKLQNVSHDANTLGSSGPIQVSYPTDYSPTHNLWHPTLNAVGVETNSSHVGGSNVGVWTCVNAVDPRSATRSFSTGYCSAVRSNLHILTNATVNEIVLQEFDGQYVATGVRFSCKGQEHTVSASREVILSAGAIKSPQILELSGIGNPKVLAQAKVPVKVDSPTVGENLQDHLSKHPKPLSTCLLT